MALITDLMKLFLQHLFTLIFTLIFLSCLGTWGLHAQDKFNIFVNDRETSDAPYRLEVRGQQTIGELKKMVQELGLDPSSLVYSRRQGLAFKDDLSLVDYNFQKDDTFFARKLVQKTAKEIEQEKFIKAAWEGDDKTVKKILKVKSKSQRKDFIANCRSHNDHDKIALYLAARMGHVQVLKAIKKLVGEEAFRELLTITDSEERTVFMAAAQAVKNKKRVIKYIKKYSSQETLQARDYFHRSAYDWAKLRDENNEDILSLLEFLSGK